MGSNSRKVIHSLLNHCYQRTLQGHLIFYAISDYLVYFTLFSTEAAKHRVRILSLCLMPDHVHISMYADTVTTLSRFMKLCSQRFARVHNETCHRKGAFFDPRFGSVPVHGDKKARSNLCYVGNNPVERHLCNKAEEYRWNFLAYHDNAHPFSEPLVLRSSRKPVKRAVKEVDFCREKNLPLSYRQLQRLFNPLNNKEKQQLIDYIVTRYNIIDYASAIRFFDSYQEMLDAMHANTGAEHDLNEIFVGRSDTCYTKMVHAVMKDPEIQDIHDIFSWPINKRIDLYYRLCSNFGFPEKQVIKFLRLVPEDFTPFRRDPKNVDN